MYLFDDFMEVFNKSLNNVLREKNVNYKVNYGILKNSNINLTKLKLKGNYMKSIILKSTLAREVTFYGKYSAEVNIGIAELTVTYEFGPFGTVTRTSVSDSIISDEDTEVTKGKYEIFENTSHSNYRF